MENDTLKKSLAILVFTCLFSLTVSPQNKKIKQFANEFSIYLTEMEVFMSAKSNDESKSIFKNFIKNSETLSQSEKLRIIKVSNIMLSKSLRSYPHFNKFLSTICSVNNSVNGDFLLSNWLQVIDETLEGSTINKFLLFCTFTSDLIASNTLRESKSATWRVSNSDFLFKFEVSAPFVVFSELIDLTCSSNDGSYTLFSTKGEYHFIKNKWFGNDGWVNWETHGLSKDSIFAKIHSYEIDTRKTELVSDSAIFYNKYDLYEPVIGQFINKLAKGKKADMLPSFTSYSKNIELKEIFSNIDYRGGYKMQGTKFIADGGKYAEAKIVFKRDGRDIFIANANRFSIGSDMIVAQEAGVKIFFDNDSIFHGNLQFKYINSQRKLQLHKQENGISGAPMLNTYHNVTMDFELLEWNIDSEIITFGSLPGTAESSVEFESVDRFLKSNFESLRGIDAIHPLLLLNNYVRDNKEDNFYVDDFARYARFPLVQIKHYLIRLANDGFIFYDFGLQKVSVLSKLFNYVDAASGLGDYDLISFRSRIKSGEYKTDNNYLVNAALNLETKDLNIIGIHNIEVSQKRGVYLYPKDGIIVVKKNRDFVFNGQIYAGKGRLNLFGRDFLFHYDDFKLDLNHIDSIQFSVPIKPIKRDLYGNELLTTIKTVIEAVTGELRIDDPDNKSGIRKDSFPQYPIFKSFEDSYAYYDRKSIYNGIYSRDGFSFHLQPFEIDSLDDYTGSGLWFAGVFESSNIFPAFDDTLRLQDDYSLGFSRKTPIEGFSIYSGKGRFYNDIHLSHKGLKGSGEFEYLTSKASANKIDFFPDSANLYTQLFSIDEVDDGVEFPDVKNTDTYAHFEPYRDRLSINKISNEFDFFTSKATLNGDLLLRPTGVTASGTMSIDNAKVNSNLFTCNSSWFASDTASLRVFENTGNLAFKAIDLRANIDVSTREGVFHSNGSASYVELPANRYISYIDKMTWSMDKQYIMLGDRIASGEGSEFVSIHSEQDSLRFFAKTAFYNLSDYIIHADGVDAIAVADAQVYPDSGRVTIAKNAIMETLFDASILANNLTEYHTFTNATVNIKTAHNYLASGNYTYKDALNNEQQIFFNDIKVDLDTVTIAKGSVKNDDIFHIDSQFDFKGTIDLVADQKNLNFDGYFMINHDCAMIGKEWIKFKSKIDPQNIIFSLDDQVFNQSEELLSTALVMSFDSTDFYSTFLSKMKRNALDISVLSASYSLKYDENKFAYNIGGPDRISNYYTLSDKECKTFGEGVIDLNLNLGQVSLQAVGNATHDMKVQKTEIEGFFMLDFFFSDEALEVMAEDLFSAPGDEIFEYDQKFSKNLCRIVGEERGEILLVDLETKDEYSNFPDEMKHSIVFTNTKFNWNNTHKAYVAKGAIAISSILDRQVNSTLDGYIIIEKGQNTDILTIYLMTELYDEYYFQYKNGIMKAWSTNLDFTTIINKIDSDKKISGRAKGAQAYRYMSAPDDVTEKFLKDVKKKY